MKTPSLSRSSKSLVGYQAQGNDFLGGRDEAYAIADTIAFKDLPTPFVVGILGGWGSGKTFTFNLIRERLKEIEQFDLTRKAISHDFPYVGHIYPILFDVWALGRGCIIWSSLICHILTELNDQLDLQATIGQQLLKEGVGVNELMDELTTTYSEMEYLKKVAQDERVQQGLREWKPKGGHVTQALINATNTKYEEEVREIAEKKEKLRKKIAEVAFKDVIADKNTSIQPEIKKLIQKAYKNYAKENVNDPFPQTVDDAMKSWEGIFGPLKRYCFQLWAGRLTSLWYTLFLSSLTIVIPLVLENTYILAIAAAIACLTALQFKHNDASKKLKSAQEEINKVEGELRLLNKKQILEKLAEPQGLSDSDEEEQQDIIARLNFEIISLEDRLWLREGDSLNKALGNRFESSNYDHRGGMYRARADLQHISDAMLSNKESFPRGDPRIVLLIDGLDLCPPEKVVETLEAVQLLVKTDLFVVVLSVDTQYVTLCLEDFYKNILDYIEKIIQLPYHVSQISNEYVKPYLQEQMNAKKEKDVIDESKSPWPNDDNDNQSQEQQHKNEPVLPDNVSDKAASDEEGLSEARRFTWEELKVLEDACAFSGVGPRSAKRLVTVFKLMKIIWHLRNETPGEGTPYELGMKEASVLILALCASSSNVVRQEMCKILAKVKQTQSIPAGCDNLKDFIKENIGKRGVEQAKDSLLSMIDDEKCRRILGGVVWKDNEDWNLMKKNLRLVQSFSFLVEYNEPVDDIHHPTQQIIAATEEKDDSVQENDSADRAVTIHRITEARETRVKFEKDLEACRHKRKEIELKYAENEKKKAKKLKPIDEEIAICKTMMKELKSTLVKYAKELNALDDDGAPERLRHESSSSSSDDSESDDSESDNDE